MRPIPRTSIPMAVVVPACLLIICLANLRRSLWLPMSMRFHEEFFQGTDSTSSSYTTATKTSLPLDANRPQQQQQQQQQQEQRHQEAFSLQESKARHINVCGSNSTSEDNEFAALCRSRFLLYAEYLLQNSGIDRLEIVQIGAHIAWDVNDVLTKGLTRYFEALSNNTMTNNNNNNIVTPSSSMISSPKFRWTFVEPSPTNYKGLVQNVQRHTKMSGKLCQTLTVNAGIVPDTTPPNTTMTFYSVDESIDPQTGYDSKSGKTLPVYITQLSGFSMKALEFNRGQFRRRQLNMDDYIIPINVTTLTFTQLMNDYGLGSNDRSVTAPTGGLSSSSSSSSSSVERPWLMLIDTEGYDCNIILGIDESSPHWPYFLIFEKNQCGPSKNPAFEYLRKVGYDIVYLASQNAVAVLNITKNLPISYYL